MPTAFGLTQQILLDAPKTWLITGVAGFIGSNLLAHLLNLNQRVVGVDNFSTGYERNLAEVLQDIHPSKRDNFRFIEGDICSIETCKQASQGVDYVLHHAALGSVSASLRDPLTTNASNVTGFLNILLTARDSAVKRVVFASSSAVYGDDHPMEPKTEDMTSSPLSPYAVSKCVDELYARVFSLNYGFHAIGLRYFNVFGSRQDPHGAYAAVIPKWIAAMIQGEDIFIHGDGESTRDFCFIDEVVQANILAATAHEAIPHAIYNVALNQSTTLNQLFELLKNTLLQRGVIYQKKPIHDNFRLGDIRYSLANISKITKELGYKPLYDLQRGLICAMPWYLNFAQT